MAQQATAVAYAALLLAGTNTAFTVDNVEKLTKKAGVNVPHQLAATFVKAFEGKDILSLLTVGGGSAAPVAQPTQQASKAVEAPKVVEKVKDPEPEEDVDMGGLFD